MAWRDNLRQARFRGVPFHYEGHDAGPYGRRLVIHEYPNRDDPYVEDMGAATPEFRLSAYVDGDDYMAKRDALIAACHQEGPGTLSHPYLGEIEVACRECTPTETVPEGRIARFALVFVLAGRNRYPAATADTRSAVQTQGAAVTGAARARLESVLDVAGPDFLAAGAAALVEAAAEAVLGETRSIGGSGQALATAVAAATSLAEEAIDLVRDPVSLGERLMGALGSLAGLGSPARLLSSMERLARFKEDRPDIPLVTPTREQQAANEAALAAAVRREAAVGAAGAAASMTFASYDEAAATRVRVGDLLDREIDIAAAEGDDDAFVALRGLYAAVVRDLTARGATLARVTTYELHATLPALVVAYAIYADAAREAEIVERNRIRHPGFIPGGLPLEILSDG